MSSIVWKMMTSVAAAPDVTSSEVRPQHTSDEKGVFEVSASADPGAGKNGGITLEGKLSPEAPWAIVATIPFSGTGSLNAAAAAGGEGIGAATVILEDVPIMPHMRVGMRANATGFNPNATNITAWLME